ncbi:MAG: 3-hydroxyacyl-CoA dehydrogenase family protein [Deltaproteobacteria bacterium]|nr:3-hydroxyacyl-CoA dehydrogenase family protein [Deltaproteobacteria bacterium]
MTPDQVKKALVVGAGTMGHSIAQVFAQAEIETHLVDLDAGALERAMDLVSVNLETLSEFGKFPAADIPAILRRIHPSTDMVSAGTHVDFAIEAVAEEAAIKKKVLGDMEVNCPEGIVIASNTSTLDIFGIADLKRPENLVAAHWFAPPHIIPLVEVCPGPETSKDTVTFTTGLMRRLGKQPITMKKFVPSFIVNRIQLVIGMCLLEMLENDWAAPEEIDKAIKSSLGIRMPVVGIVQNQDFVGLDVVAAILGENVPALLKERVEKGHLGVKTSKGFYDYGERSEADILRERDRRYLKVIESLESIGAFEPV